MHHTHTLKHQALETAVLRERAVLAMELAADLQAKGLLPPAYLQQLGRPPCLADITAALAGHVRGGEHLGPESLLPTNIFD